ncbi:hypothetical protein RJ641_035912 [Dillenia turbinata]|uniref:MENTAL domain-containing protein n=1 Tax=Dillenia turbinata TaxID=194707 RepID=A0AAN8ZGF4_9MAGN
MKPNTQKDRISPIFLSRSKIAEMGFSKEGRTTRLLRGFKTVFFLITMLISFLLFSAPVLVAIADALLPTALLSASLSPHSLSLQTISSHLNNYDFRFSLIDIPLISIFRSAVIICVYSLCDGPRLSRGPYLGITTVCSVLSLGFVSLKASILLGDSSRIANQGLYKRAMEVSACKNGFPRYQKLQREERVK